MTSVSAQDTKPPCSNLLALLFSFFLTHIYTTTTTTTTTTKLQPHNLNKQSNQ